MGYYSKSRILIRGSKEAVETVNLAIQARSELTFMGEQENRGYHWAMLKDTLEVKTKGLDSVAVFDSGWFKAYDAWDAVVEEVAGICKENEVCMAYARIGEDDSDFEAESWMTEEEDWCQIELSREFTTPWMFAEVLDES